MLYNYDRLLRIFFDDPATEEGFQLRELSRKLNLAPTSTKNYLKQLKKENLVKKKTSRVNKYPLYFANRNNEEFKFLKKLNTLKIIRESKLIEYLKDALVPDAIVLFGSASRGEDIKESDIDLFLQCRYKELDLKPYEKKLNRKINVLFSKSFEKLNDELKNNLVNGIVLDGYLEAFWNTNKNYTKQKESRIPSENG